MRFLISIFDGIYQVFCSLGVSEKLIYNPYFPFVADEKKQKFYLINIDNPFFTLFGRKILKVIIILPTTSIPKNIVAI